MNGEGLVHIYTGDGKGKTTASVGLAVRAAGSGLRVLFAQFLKGRPTGELAPLEKIGVTVVRSGAVLKFIPYMTPEELADCKKAQSDILQTVADTIGGYDLVILDEALGALSVGVIGQEALVSLVKGKPRGTELVLTGRDAPQSLLALADYVSVIEAVKHPYDRGIPARRGIEF